MSRIFSNGYVNVGQKTDDFMGNSHQNRHFYAYLIRVFIIFYVCVSFFKIYFLTYIIYKQLIINFTSWLQSYKIFWIFVLAWQSERKCRYLQLLINGLYSFTRTICRIRNITREIIYLVYEKYNVCLKFSFKKCEYFDIFEKNLICWYL